MIERFFLIGGPEDGRPHTLRRKLDVIETLTPVRIGTTTPGAAPGLYRSFYTRRRGTLHFAAGAPQCLPVSIWAEEHLDNEQALEKLLRGYRQPDPYRR